ncbi:MAG: cell division ATPase MinD [Candidatus Parvarchaeota archaeon]|nr:cell division ATPase MinD [Candidatus Jingweiarchaeum tengchongense]MCW1297682.1 cell division ATPase MinD [Candidatus Jingweiarchaeum tengchongense]MCW1299693.1 cell division ATPase MinD [Candidatus Jingweiarchaeum tengchongense]MCW1304339.1 cell division ATPase MinD [Candidatus Jingweiarchaeum tengchongense]MCW1305678.1 cell division ATPase MinD [Candidatus Jingweiarchaeum tengchongense]
MVRIIGVISGKGGVGKTTVVANLGLALTTKFNKEVIIIDCNITTSHLGLYFGLHSVTTTLNNVLRGEAIIEDAIYMHESGLKIVPASLAAHDLIGVDIIMLEKTLERLFGKADFVLLDSAPGLGREAYGTIIASKEVIMVTIPYSPAIIDLIRCNQVIKELGPRALGIVLNMVTRDRYELTEEEVSNIVGLPVIGSIPYDKNILKSLALRTPLLNYKPKSRASKEFIKLANRILEL